MPITQMRMNALIQAARDYQQALRRAIDLINEPAAALPLLQQRCREIGLLCNPIASATTINDEDNHFRRTWKENNRQANKMALKRGLDPKPRQARVQSVGRPESLIEEFVAPRSTAPESISTTPQLQGSIEADVWGARQSKTDKRKNAPPGLYDDDDEPLQSLQLRQSTHEDTKVIMTPELQAAIDAEAEIAQRAEEFMKERGIEDPLAKGIMPE